MRAGLVNANPSTIDSISLRQSHPLSAVLFFFFDCEPDYHIHFFMKSYSLNEILQNSLVSHICICIYIYIYLIYLKK